MTCKCPPRGSRAKKPGVSITEWLRKTLDRTLHSNKANPFSKVAKNERANLAAAVKSGKLFAYYTPETDKGNRILHHRISGWFGNSYASGVVRLSSGHDNFGGYRVYLRFRAPWDQNRIWSGYAMGNGVYGRFRRTKLTDLYVGRLGW